jgi:hypothetical protein
MSILPHSALKLELPPMVRVRQSFPRPCIASLEDVMGAGLRRPEIASRIKPAHRVAILVGSRGITDLARIVRHLGDEIKARGAHPFIIPAMGSHGGATAEGQKKVLRDLGVSERTMAMPVHSSMDVVEIGRVAGDVPVFTDAAALAADMLVPVNRVKPHTGFRGPVESGLCKMLALGLGKHEGASHLHHQGYGRFGELIPEAAALVLNRTGVGFGVAILENAYKETAAVEFVPAEALLEMEPSLFREAVRLFPQIMLPGIDVLVVERIGKDISGTGMDLNIVDRPLFGRLPGYHTAGVDKIVVLDLSDRTRGNATGIGVADFITRRAFSRIDLAATYTNAVTSTNTLGGKIPITMDTEREAVIAAIKCCHGIKETDARIARIRDTLDLGRLWISENLLDDHRDRAGA